MSTRHQHVEAPMSVKIPADVDQPDKILYGLTAKQVTILAGTAAACLWVLLTFGPLVPFPVLVAVLVPVAAAGIVLAFARHDGMNLDRYTLAAFRHLRASKQRVTTSEPVQPPPAWCRMRGRLPEPLRLPVRTVRQDGALELAQGGVAVIVRAGTVAFGLRTAGEQAGLVAVFGRWLNSLDAPVQILVQARPVDLTGLADHITRHAPALPDPALEEAARAHAAFLTDLGTEHDLLIRQVLIAITGHIPASATASVLPWRRRERRRVGRDSAAAVALRRAAEAVQSLAALGVPAEVLDANSTTAALTESLSPGEPPLVDTPTSDDVITHRKEG
ncbi:PrgI family protein [Actinomadura sp. LD22]|uniref:PrgI family protein n=1 Tax=Actinomadura physcomitrii TaxID=2650748 RepID=A0A6I4MAV2_9ACTN|nr:PrgI family protein [Actinomadura physcomitrii]MWA02773.1 PrgI family protein [Actinomadura physcomitrii]